MCTRSVTAQTSLRNERTTRQRQSSAVQPVVESVKTLGTGPRSPCGIEADAFMNGGAVGRKPSGCGRGGGGGATRCCTGGRGGGSGGIRGCRYECIASVGHEGVPAPCVVDEALPEARTSAVLSEAHSAASRGDEQVPVGPALGVVAGALQEWVVDRVRRRNHDDTLYEGEKKESVVSALRNWYGTISASLDSYGTGVSFTWYGTISAR
ncbi:hypothetical protein B0H10DRAFT_1938150 [Mycena sp. CBHHK59/15]|nr:hypothetical protein B0H10DRAFT_1938150 [Mycena sp. CBHHK59/15]